MCVCRLRIVTQTGARNMGMKSCGESMLSDDCRERDIMKSGCALHNVAVSCMFLIGDWQSGITYMYIVIMHVVTCVL